MAAVTDIVAAMATAYGYRGYGYGVGIGFGYGEAVTDSVIPIMLTATHTTVAITAATMVTRIIQRPMPLMAALTLAAAIIHMPQAAMSASAHSVT